MQANTVHWRKETTIISFGVLWNIVELGKHLKSEDISS
jgi:hypothetical protein